MKHWIYSLMLLSVSTAFADSSDPTPCDDQAKQIAVQVFSALHPGIPYGAGDPEVVTFDCNLYTYEVPVFQNWNNQGGCGVGSVQMTIDLDGCKLYSQPKIVY